MRCGLLKVVTLGCVVLASACSADDPAVPEAAADSVTSTTAGRVTVSSLVATTGSDSTTPVTVDLPTLTRACEEYVPLAAFTGDGEMQALWTSVAEDAAVLAIWCAEVANSDPERLAPMVDGLARIRAGLEPAMTVTTVSTTAPPATDVTDTSAAAPTAASDDAPAPSPAASTSVVASGERGVMPGVVCLLLRDAEDALAAVGVFAVTALDLSGDAGDTDEGAWIVVTQSPFRGSVVGDDAVRLGVLPPGEPTSC